MLPLIRWIMRGAFAGLTEGCSSLSQIEVLMSAKMFAQSSVRSVTMESLESRKLLAAVGSLVGGVDPYNMGKGEWIWDMSKARAHTSTTSVQGLIDFLKARGVKWLIVKAGDGNNG